MGKQLHPIYDKPLVHRGSLTFRVDADAMNNGFHYDHRGRRGRSQRYTDRIICTFLILKWILNLTLRAAQGLFDSPPQLMNGHRLARMG